MVNIKYYYLVRDNKIYCGLNPFLKEKWTPMNNLENIAPVMFPEIPNIGWMEDFESIKVLPVTL